MKGGLKLAANLTQLFAWVGDILGLVRDTAAAISELWIFPVAVAFFVAGLTISIIARFLNKRKGGKRRGG